MINLTKTLGLILAKYLLDFLCECPIVGELDLVVPNDVLASIAQSAAAAAAPCVGGGGEVAQAADQSEVVLLVLF